MKFKDLSNDQLAKEKLIAEIKSHRIYKQPAFWTFIVILITAGTGFYTGLFQAQRTLIELQNVELSLKRDALSLKIDSLENEFNKLRHDNDSIYIVANNLQNEQDSIKKKYAIWKKTKQSKEELQTEVLDYVNTLRVLISEYKAKSDEILYEMRTGSNTDSLWNVHSNKISFISTEYMNKYKNLYKTQSILYRDKLIEYLSNYKSVYGYVDYLHVVNFLGIEAIADDLEYMANELEK